MKICIFAGTFNPIHKAHLEMAEYALNKYKFDKILFIPAYKPPHKDYQDCMSKHRLNMVKIATAYNPKFEVSDIEYKREGKSYTYLTTIELKKLYNVKDRFNFIIGTDAFEKIESWYETDKLKELVNFIIFIRQNEVANFDNLKEKGYKFEFAQMDFHDISSTQLRERIKNNLPINDLVTKEVEDYINTNGLYRNN